MDEKKIRLTQMVSSAGCASKIFPSVLSDLLKDIDWTTNDNVIVGFSGKDDAGIYKINDNLALVHTTDFFPAVVDDPYTFGQIAAANALSDIYAMGGKPINALNIVAFPQNEDISILKEIIKGGHDKAKEAGCVIIGGHSIDIPNIIYGLAVTGIINPKDIKKNNSSRPGDVLILTKPLGTGLLINSIKYSKLKNDIYESLIYSMTRLNRYASEEMINYNASGCTDITGFGIAGHTMQFAIESKVVFRININELPMFDGVFDAINQNLLTRCDKSNRFFVRNNIKTEGTVNKELEHIIYDPQTSGGLLISVPESNSKNLIKALHEKGDKYSRVIGEVLPADKNHKAGTVIFNFN